MARPTLTDFTTRLNTAESTLRSATRVPNDAQEELAYAEDEHRYFTQQERDTRIANALPKVENAERAAAQAVDAILALTRDVASVTTNPIPSLASEDETTAASRAGFIKEDVESLSLEYLTARIRQAALNNDRVRLFLFHRPRRPLREL